MMCAYTPHACRRLAQAIGVMSYEGYGYTDSNQFCGAVCHTVMEPEYTAYAGSPHSRVKCVACHIAMVWKKTVNKSVAYLM